MALIINGKRVTDEQLYDEMENLKSAAAQAGQAVNCCERDDEFMVYARENMIARVLLEEVAKREGIIVSPEEIDKAFDDIVEQAGSKEMFYINYSTSEEEIPQFKQGMTNNLLVQKVLDAAVGPKQEPTDEQVEAFYQEHIDQYQTTEQVRVSHILKSLDHGADPREAYQTLRDLREKLLNNGANFAKLADEHSDKPGEGGDLGFFSRGELVEEFEAVAFSLEEGEISPVYLSPFGYHLTKLTGRKLPEPIPLDEIRDTVKEQCRDTLHQEKMQKYVESLKEGAEIEEVEEEIGAEE